MRMFMTISACYDFVKDYLCDARTSLALPELQRLGCSIPWPCIRPLGPAFGDPADGLQWGTQYAAASRLKS